MSEETRIYVGGLATETTTEGLQMHFGQYGEVIDAVVMQDKLTGRSRCFGFVTFADIVAMHACLGTSNVIDGREVSCRKAVREPPPSFGDPAVGSTAKLFVGGLPATCDQHKFTVFFQQFGPIKEAVVMMDSTTQRHRGFGYVTFAEAATADAVLANYGQNHIDGKWIDVKRSIPQDKMNTMKGDKGFKGKGGGKSDWSNGKGHGQGSSGVVVLPPGAGYEHGFHQQPPPHSRVPPPPPPPPPPAAGSQTTLHQQQLLQDHLQQQLLQQQQQALLNQQQALLQQQQAPQQQQALLQQLVAAQTQAQSGAQPDTQTLVHEQAQNHEQVQAQAAESILPDLYKLAEMQLQNQPTRVVAGAVPPGNGRKGSPQRAGAAAAVGTVTADGSSYGVATVEPGSRPGPY